MGRDAHLRYPTPVHTSSTGILSSSPLRRNSAAIGAARANNEKRTPLGALPSVELAENGEPLLMGRSSNSSHYQLSASRLISRVHVKARYVAATPREANKVEIICEGWNGLKLHCQGRSWDLAKGDTFTSETEAEIMIDVQEARVLLQWPRLSGTADGAAHLSDSSWDDSPPRSQTRPGLLESSPLRRASRIRSPESPTPIHLSSSQRLHDLLPGLQDRESAIQIYEDEPELPGHEHEARVDPNASIMTEMTDSFRSNADEDDEDEEHNPDEENDPIVHSFGPFGADISNRLASIMGKSPRARKPLGRDIPQIAENPEASETHTESSLPSDPPSPEVDEKTPSPEEPLAGKREEEEEEEEQESTPQKPKVAVHPSVGNHVVNQLAYSRLSSTPLSSIMQHLPADLKVGLTSDALRDTIESTTCIGIITRQGKDAAGKALESEYYYVPEQDNDDQRRAAVVDGLRKPSLRNCRKQHKQYYWKRPRTP
ncbi:hypothetical protein NLG97_g6469 [Lecanicillium saksenae]|uniref:Uncharacterized protein n=1 Tax=Lecanicillium saksenae TaxID=468837 RepID=A0ACC1QPK2_9HYPO|nr:hypothetical protein NLG97_g6469 [Lecanicillium saksenae]